MSHDTLKREIDESPYRGFLEGMEAIKAGKLKVTRQAHLEFEDFCNKARRMFEPAD